MLDKPQALHFTGIGGAGMSGLAELMHQLGCAVRGSDLRLTPVTERLASLGIPVLQGHAAHNLAPDAAALVITSAVDAGNPELAEARRRGLPVVLRGELLAELMRARRGVAIAGSHGKTTTTTMLASICLRAGLEPTIVVGGSVPALDGANAKLGTGDLLICESDESDGSFLLLAPHSAAITNIDHEHLEHYGSFEGLRQAFVDFANRVSWQGAVAACIDDAELARALPQIRRRVITYGNSSQARLRIVRPVAGAAGISFELVLDGTSLGGFEAPVLGEHNILNAAAAAALALELGTGIETVRSALAAFRGPGRRMECKGVERGVTVVDDYGHHPAEIRATLRALRPSVARGRLMVLFQPHRYTRTRALMNEFADCFRDADIVRVVDLYAASEPPIEGISAPALAARIHAAGHPDAEYAGSVAAAAAGAAAASRAGDTILTLGAGSITEAAELVLQALRKGEHSGQTQGTGN
ncbi:MAG: UDP-N-acetylmuramate--L-alanine ligase [Bryobacteraceae bacterium]